MSTSRNTTDEAGGARIRGVMLGGVSRRETSQDASAFGQSRIAGLTYRQDAFGSQLGVDFGGARALGSIEGFGDYSHDYKGGGGRTGLRIGF